MMPRQTLALLCVVLFGASDAIAQNNWTTFAPGGGNFMVSIPALVETLPVEKDTFNGTPLEIHLFRIRASGLIYILGWTEYNQSMNVEAELDMNRDNFVKGVKGRLTGETRISQNGVAGREFTGEDGSGNFFVSRLFVSGSRAWQAAVLVTPGFDDTRTVTRFLYSFQLTGSR